MFFICSVATEWLHRYFLAMCIISAIVMVIHILKESGHQLYDLRLRYLEIMSVLARHDMTNQQFELLLSPLLSKRFLVSVSKPLSMHMRFVSGLSSFLSCNSKELLNIAVCT